MKTIDEIRMCIRSKHDVLTDKYGIRVIGIFGSYARGRARPRSDLDVLAETVRPVSLFDLVGAELYLGDALGMKVDLVLKRNVREEAREAILRETLAI